MDKLNNTLTAAALSLGVDAEDLAQVLPALKSLRQFRANGVAVRIENTEAWEPLPALNRNLDMVRVELTLHTYRKEKDGQNFTTECLDSLAKAFFGPR